MDLRTKLALPRAHTIAAILSLVAVSAGCHGSTSGASAQSATTVTAAEDPVVEGLLEHHRYHHHGGETLFIAMSIDTLGVSPEQRAAVEKIRLDLHRRMEPSLGAEQALALALADGIDAGTFDSARIDGDITKIGAAAAEVHGSCADALNELHAALTREQRAELSEKVESHWQMWQRANVANSGGGGSSTGDRYSLSMLTGELDLGSDQVAKIRANLNGSGAAADLRPCPWLPIFGYSILSRGLRRARAHSCGRYQLSSCGDGRLAPDPIRRGRRTCAFTRATRHVLAGSPRSRSSQSERRGQPMKLLKATRAARILGVLALEIAAVGSLLMAGAGCEVSAQPAYPTAGYYSTSDYPPDEYIATTEPVYFEGHASYWYGGQWYYRDGGGRWGHYDREPGYLYQRRMAAPPARRGYETHSRGAPSRGGGGGRHR